jgi:hypothetical protein
MPKSPSQEILLIFFYTRLINHFIPRDASISNKKHKTSLEICSEIEFAAKSEKGG